MQVYELPIDEIVPYVRNQKKHDKTQIANVAQSLAEFGWVQPVVVDKDNNIIIGHCRILAAQKLAKSDPAFLQVPVVKLEDLSPEEANKLRLLDNKLNESDWDMELLAEDIPDLDFFGYDLNWELPAIEDDEEVIEDEEPEPPVEPKSRLGDIYQLGEHRLICGDSTSVDVLATLCNGEKVDLYLTDPPYNVDYTGKTKDALKIENDHKDDATFRQFLVDAFSAASAVMKAGAVFYIWHADSEGFNFRGACQDVGWKVRECLIWLKNVMVMGRQDYQWKHEPCLYGWQEGASHGWYSDRKQTTILEFNRPTRNKEHPTMKPVALFDYLIKNSSKPGDIVLDSFGGSGTSIIACEQNGRRCYTVELDPRYVDVIVTRWENLTGQKAVLLNRNEEDEA